MADRGAAEAAEDYRSAIRRIVSCITHDIILDQGEHKSPTQPRLLQIPGGKTLLKMHETTDTRLSFAFAYGYQAIMSPEGDWQIIITGYHYSFKLNEGQELLAYHWHPEPGQLVAYPHLHIEAGSGISFENLHKTHLPTGVVSPEKVILSAIEGLCVEPAREDWRSILEHAAYPSPLS